MSNSNNYIDIKGLLDTVPPLNEHLSGVYKKSFAYTTIKDRLPVILTRVVDTMSRDKDEIIRKFGNESSEEIKQVIGNISKLRSELMTNKPLTPLVLANSEADGDAAVWNNYLKTRASIEGANLTWFNTVWLLSECYMYRRINQALVLTKSLKNYDPFENQKHDAFTNSLKSIKFLAKHTMSLLARIGNVSTAERKHEFAKLLKLNLWGNRCDLSLSAGAESNSVGNPVELLNSYEQDILIDDTRVVWELLNRQMNENYTKIVDIVLDNAGYELFTDFCVATFLVAHGLAEKVRFHVKRIPWFVSDVNLHDFHWMIENMRQSSDLNVKALGDVGAEHLQKNRWTVEVESFWTEPYDFGQMKEKCPSLYGKLAESVLIMFKGDLNYRKLMNDINWEYTTSLETVLRMTNFRPTNIVALRTLKADVCVGLTMSQVEELSEKDKNWMVTGKYGVIHATGETPCICNDNS